MSVEQAVRKHHAFQDRLRFFLMAAAVMTDREIELALARMADGLPTTIDPDRLLFNGQVLKAYYDLRRSGQAKHRAFKRMAFKSVPGIPPWPSKAITFTEHMVKGVSEFQLLVPGQQAAGIGTWQHDLIALIP
ncbi:hypothetical protein [Frateuria sp.]|uniref:hypothetical protein n=1 Tax=Frateuria sp. TaxID=2211372 RepID=UPI003F803A78